MNSELVIHFPFFILEVFDLQPDNLYQILYKIGILINGKSNASQSVKCLLKDS